MVAIFLKDAGLHAVAFSVCRREQIDMNRSTERCPSGCPWHHTWPRNRFFSLRVYDAKTISFRDVALPVLTHLVGASFISVRVSVHTFKVTSFAVECGAAVTYVRTYVFCALWVLTAPVVACPSAASVVAGKPSQADIKSHMHCLLHKHKCSPWLCSIRWAVS